MTEMRFFLSSLRSKLWRRRKKLGFVFGFLMDKEMEKKERRNGFVLRFENVRERRRR